ncbi:MAG TPA: hypothetical protein VMV10_25815 [Pirellulales bacterium]|nr:hypothetical protein [Pirellulales bacterium]
MKGSDRELHQQLAILGARQGDPESPASGTLYARRRRLQAELEQANLEQAGEANGKDLPTGAVALEARTRHSRPIDTIDRELRRVEQEIGAVQRQIDSISRIVARHKKAEARR